MREQHPAGLIRNSAASWQFWAAWHVTAAVTVAVTPIRARLGPVWEFSTDTFFVVGGLLLTYAGSIALLAQRARSDRRIDLRTLIATISPAITLFLLFLVLVRPKYSRPVVLVSLMLVPTFASLATRIPPRFRTVAFTAVLVFALAGFVPRVSHTHERPSAAKNNVVASGLYSLTVSSYPLDLGAQEVTGGAIALLGDAYVLSEGDGELYALSWDRETKRLESRRLRSRVPLNREEFIRDTSYNPSIDSGVFRTADILIQQNEDTFQLFAAHHHWNTAKKCFTVRVSATNGTVRAFLQDERPQDWRSVYESAPCLTFKKTGNPFVGYQIGGQLELLDSNHLLLALGDHGLDGVNDEDRVSQDENTSYGKIVLIDLITGASSTFSRGHRNPQGLHVDAQGAIWSTEHGPRGGDELNLIRQGANYGWPFVTYGANYQTNDWPL